MNVHFLLPIYLFYGGGFSFPADVANAAVARKRGYRWVSGASLQVNMLGVVPAFYSVWAK